MLLHARDAVGCDKDLYYVFQASSTADSLVRNFASCTECRTCVWNAIRLSLSGYDNIENRDKE